MSSLIKLSPWFPELARHSGTMLSHLLQNLRTITAVQWSCLPGSTNWPDILAPYSATYWKTWELITTAIEGNCLPDSHNWPDMLASCSATYWKTWELLQLYREAVSLFKNIELARHGAVIAGYSCEWKWSGWGHCYGRKQAYEEYRY